RSRRLHWSLAVGQSEIPSPLKCIALVCHACSMPKRISTAALNDVQNARRGGAESESAVSLTLVSKIMSEMGRKGGRIGGKRRLETMTPSQRKAVAKKAARARWGKRKRHKTS